MPFSLMKTGDIETITNLFKQSIIGRATIDFAIGDYPYIVQSPIWPEAIHESQIISDKTDKDAARRSEAIINELCTLGCNRYDKILDFGCGDTIHASNNIVGYDIVDTWGDSTQNNTTDWADVISRGPYGGIILYDVIDHMLNWDCLESINEVMPNGGKIYARCHPFFSIHGGHMYTIVNKAYAHLIMNDFLLSAYEKPHTNIICDYEETYANIWDILGWKVINKRVYKCMIPSPLDTDEKFISIIKNRFFRDMPDSEVREKISVSFIDYFMEST